MKWCDLILLISIHNFWWLQKMDVTNILWLDLFRIGAKQVQRLTYAEIAVGRTKRLHRPSDNHWVTSDAWRTHSRTSEDDKPSPLTSLTSIGRTTPEYRTSDRRCDTSNAKHWRHLTSERIEEEFPSFTSYLRTHILEVPDVLNISRKLLELTACVRTQKTSLPDVRHHQRLVDSSAAFYPLTAFIGVLFGLL